MARILGVIAVGFCSQNSSRQQIWDSVHEFLPLSKRWTFLSTPETIEVASNTETSKRLVRFSRPAITKHCLWCNNKILKNCKYKIWMEIWCNQHQFFWSEQVCNITIFCWFDVINIYIYLPWRWLLVRQVDDENEIRDGYLVTIAWDIGK